MIRVYQCRCDRCAISGRKFWFSEIAGVPTPFTSWRAALDQAISDSSLLAEATA
jgi:hypothetical protein